MTKKELLAAIKSGQPEPENVDLCHAATSTEHKKMVQTLSQLSRGQLAREEESCPSALLPPML